MKKLSILALIISIAASCLAQNPYSKTIKMQAEKMGDLLVKNKFKSFAIYTHPKIIEMMGGEDKMVEIMNTGLQKMKSNNVEISSVTFEEPNELFVVGNELQCTVPQILTMKVPGGILVTKSTLIALSSNNGRNWYFIDTSGRSIEEMKEKFPNLSEQLVCPEWQKPVLYRE